MVKMEKTTASRRFRRRYIGFIMESDGFINRNSMIKAIRDSCYKMDMDYRKMGISLIRFDGKLGVVRCNHMYKWETIDLLNSIDKIGLYNVKIRTISTSGTIKALLRKNSILKNLENNNSRNRKLKPRKLEGI